MFDSFLSSNGDFFTSRRGVVIEKNSGFNSKNASFFYRIAISAKMGFISLMKEKVLTLLKNDDRATQCTAFEILAGVMRAQKYMNAEEVFGFLFEDNFH